MKSSDNHLSAHVLVELIGKPAILEQRLTRGRNSKVKKFVCRDGSMVVGKFFSTDARGKARMDVEYTALTFLWKHGVGVTPRPLGIFPDHRCIFYEFVDADSIDPRFIARTDIDHVCSFLVKLSELSILEESNDLPLASEAFFSLHDIVENLYQRVRQLQTLPQTGINKDLSSFMIKDFAPTLDMMVEWSHKKYREFGISYTDQLEQRYRTLSPSDFGLHNILRKPNGELLFLDFEHFGWDDPVKLLSDFLVYPDKPIPQAAGQYFVTQMLQNRRYDPTLGKRLSVVYPFFGLKWCLIFLNEFLPEHFERRKFAHEDIVRKEHAQQEQLRKVKKIFTVIRSTYDTFPYGI